jgi:hypothetical protein
MTYTASAGIEAALTKTLRPRFPTSGDQLLIEIERDDHPLIGADAAAPEFGGRLTCRRFDLFGSCHSLPCP